MSGTLAEGRSDLGVRLAPAAVAVGEVGHSEDAGQQRDGLALQPLKVAGAVVIFAVIPHGLGHPVYDLEFLNDAAAPLYIGLVELYCSSVMFRCNTTSSGRPTVPTSCSRPA